eukprot:CAMPEP_0206063112 /NCGR_PEP_ID=MMETSP1466-20131121/58066_1 /ASSEMBLY_ACC=CAM_ASM_001126 /TAXON_ID=44452 /ORGANISM="Pavlova gyrans, Strain CCMP608" /LENGTH=490 /DNA_ID=CAMNT_0053438481 /DNA_START=92 /DNA_END=1562 /DNA_ORIENTATION=+
MASGAVIAAARLNHGSPRSCDGVAAALAALPPKDFQLWVARDKATGGTVHAHGSARRRLPDSGHDHTSLVPPQTRVIRHSRVDCRGALVALASSREGGRRSAPQPGSRMRSASRRGASAAAVEHVVCEESAAAVEHVVNVGGDAEHDDDEDEDVVCEESAAAVEHVVNVGGDAEHDDDEDEVDDEAVGGAHLGERVLHLAVEVDEVIVGAVHLVRDLVHHGGLEAHLLLHVQGDVAQVLHAGADGVQLPVDALVCGLELLQPLLHVDVRQLRVRCGMARGGGGPAATAAGEGAHLHGDLADRALLAVGGARARAVGAHNGRGRKEARARLRVLGGEALLLQGLHLLDVSEDELYYLRAVLNLLHVLLRFLLACVRWILAIELASSRIVLICARMRADISTVCLEPDCLARSSSRSRIASRTALISRCTSRLSRVNSSKVAPALPLLARLPPSAVSCSMASSLRMRAFMAWPGWQPRAGSAAGRRTAEALA